MNLILETERLLIRPFTLEDIDPAYEMNLDAEVSKFTGDGGVVSKSEIKRNWRSTGWRDEWPHFL